MKKIIFSVLIVLVVLTVLSLMFFRRGEFHYSGVMEAVEIDVPSRLSDTISALYAEEGDNVKQGFLLAELECKEVALNEAIAEKQFKRAEQLLKTTAGSRENYDLGKNKYDTAALHKSWCKIYAPIDGKILYKFYEPNEFVAAGRKIYGLADLSKIDAWVYVDYAKLAFLNAGQKVSGYLPEADKHFDGVILALNEEAEFTPKNVQTRKERERLVYGVKVRFNNDEALTLKPGMTIEVDF